MKRTLLLALLLCAPLARAQETPCTTSRLEPDSIGIGDRFDLVIEVEKDLVQVVEFPTFEPPAGSGFEVVALPPVDTLERDGRRLRLAKRYRLAAFEEGRFNLGRAQVLYADKNILDTLQVGDSLLLEVGTFRIDSTSHSIFDLKGQRTLPFRFAEIRGYVAWGLAALALLAAAAWALRRWLAARGRRLGDLFRPAPPLPPHVAAIRALEALHHQKLWQNNRHKLYYSGLTDILRTYIAARWEIGAMEMTSDEIVAALRDTELPDKARRDLGAILRNADLVKFAKATPEAEENEADYLKCYYFVEETKPADPDPATLEEKMENDR
ncbi:protein BatD [Alistipes sp.]|uniref:protein BatD n=1 Tax=Alistipes sp. TaxID=1872444 RepID=UPI0011DCFE71|nr:protein BatD [Alistipes sp.]